MALHDVPMPPELAVGEPPLTDDDIAAYIAPYPVDDGPAEGAERVARFRVENDQQAEWAARKMAAALAAINEQKLQAQEWVLRIEQARDTACAADEQTALLMEGLLADYALRVHASTGRSTVLPSASMTVTVHKPQVVVTDDEDLAEWLEEEAGVHDDPTVVKVTHKVYVAELRKIVRPVELNLGQWDVEVTMECGHTHSLGPFTEPDDFSIPARGQRLLCPSGDGIEEHWSTVEVVVSRERQRLVPAFVDDLDVIPPGCEVRPARTTVSVRPR